MPLPPWIFGALLALSFLGWLIIRAIRNSEDPRKLRKNWIITLTLVAGALTGIFTETGNNSLGAFVVPFVCVAFGIVMSILWAPSIGTTLASALTSLYDGGSSEITPEPLYSIAIAKRQRGLYEEAIEEIQKQLRRFPSDPTGQMLLAAIQAEDFRDLDTAQATIDLFLAQSGHAPKNIAYALNLMADWHLKYHMDSEAARQSLEEILIRLPETPQAHAASQRLSHLGDDTVRFANHDPAPIKLKQGVRNIGLLKSSSHLRPPERSSESLAQDYVRHLEEFPLDNEIREKLAMLYASHYQRVDLANSQLEDLIAQPNAPASDVVQWLNLLADIQVEHNQNYQEARNALDRIIKRYPEQGSAAQASQRINYLELEIKGKKKNQAIKLGSSEEKTGESTAPPEQKSSLPE